MPQGAGASNSRELIAGNVFRNEAKEIKSSETDAGDGVSKIADAAVADCALRAGAHYTTSVLPSRLGALGNGRGQAAWRERSEGRIKGEQFYPSGLVQHAAPWNVGSDFKRDHRSTPGAAANGPAPGESAKA
jgi:hypothetical protein